MKRVISDLKMEIERPAYFLSANEKRAVCVVSRLHLDRTAGPHQKHASLSPLGPYAALEEKQLLTPHCCRFNTDRVM